MPTVLAAARAIAFSVLDLMTDRVGTCASQRGVQAPGGRSGAAGALFPADALPPVDPESMPPYVREHLLRTLR